MDEVKVVCEKIVGSPRSLLTLKKCIESGVNIMLCVKYKDNNLICFLLSTKTYSWQGIRMLIKYNKGYLPLYFNSIFTSSSSNYRHYLRCNKAYNPMQIKVYCHLYVCNFNSYCRKC